MHQHIKTENKIESEVAVKTDVENQFYFNAASEYQMRAGAGSTQIECKNPGVTEAAAQFLAEIESLFVGNIAPGGLYSEPLEIKQQVKHAAEWLRREKYQTIENPGDSIERNARLESTINLANGDFDESIWDQVEEPLRKLVQDRKESLLDAAKSKPGAIDEIATVYKERQTLNLESLTNTSEYAKLLRRIQLSDDQLAIQRDEDIVPRSYRNDIRSGLANRTMGLMDHVVSSHPETVIREKLTRELREKSDSHVQQARSIARELTNQFDAIRVELQNIAAVEAQANGLSQEQIDGIEDSQFTKCSNGEIFARGPKAWEVEEQAFRLASAAKKPIANFLRDQLQQRLLDYAKQHSPAAAPQEDSTCFHDLLLNLFPNKIANQLHKMAYDFVSDSATVYRCIASDATALAKEAYRFAHPIIDLSGRDSPRLNVIPSCHTTVWLPEPRDADEVKTMERFQDGIRKCAEGAIFIVTDQQEHITVARYMAGFPASAMASSQVLTRMLSRAVKNGHEPFIFQSTNS